MAWQGLVVFILSFAVLFALLFASFQLNYRPVHSADTVPVTATVTQAQAIGIIDHELKQNVPGFEEAYFHFQYYNFSSVDYQEDPRYQEYIRSLGPGWKLSHMKEKPELLSLPLYFVHSNGTVYTVSNDSYEKICDEPSLGCPMGRMGNFARDRLVYEVGAMVIADSLDRDIHYIIDAETGKLVYHMPYSDPGPMVPISVLENRDSIRGIREAIENTDAWISVDIVANASVLSENDFGSFLQGFEPAEVRETANNSTVGVRWTNGDGISHTVTSDDRYTDILGVKFDSGVIGPGHQYDFVFIEPRYYQYHCEIHPWMKGAIDIVESFE